MESLISFDDETNLDADTFVGIWNTFRSHESVAAVVYSTDTFNADWMAYLAAASSAVQILAWVTVPNLKDAIKQLFPSRAAEVEEWIFEEHRTSERVYVRIRVRRVVK